MSRQQWYQKLLAEWCPGCSSQEALVRVFEKVRDIPYGSTGERDPQRILEAGLGSCSGKHLLLKGLFDQLGYQSRILTCYHYFNEALPAREYPEPLQTLITQYTIIDFHHVVQLQQNTKWLIVDVTWDPPLLAYGFPVNMNWKGDTDTQVAVKPRKWYAPVEDLITFKEQLLMGLTAEEREIRKRFLELLTAWFTTLRTS